MNPDYVRIIAASDEDRRGLFAATARRIGTTEQNVEKDFWVCWTLDTLFHRLPAGGPRLLFKGGTSLSKAFGLIDRLSEDIDVTVFRSDLGEPAPLEELEGLTGKKRRARLDAIKDACRHYVHGDLRTQLAHAFDTALQAAGRRHAAAGVVGGRGRSRQPDPAHPLPERRGGARQLRSSAVKIELGAKSALDPHVAASVEPFIASDMATTGLRVRGDHDDRSDPHVLGQGHHPPRASSMVRAPR